MRNTNELYTERQIFLLMNIHLIGNENQYSLTTIRQQIILRRENS